VVSVTREFFALFAKYSLTSSFPAGTPEEQAENTNAIIKINDINFVKLFIIFHTFPDWKVKSVYSTGASGRVILNTAP